MSDHALSTTNTAIVRRKGLREQLNISDTTLWRMRHELPAPIQISKGVKGWRQSDINTWLETRQVPR